MNGFRYTLTLFEPVLANSLGGEPNSANSLYYVPGGLIRGAAINAYDKVIDAGDDIFRRLFLDGTTRFLNAYPLTKDDKKRSLPTPRKLKPRKYFDASDFSIIEGDNILALEEEWQVNVHTQRDAALGHATDEAGAVYRYIAIPAGMTLQGAVLTESQADAEEIERLLKNKTILLGKARTAGYGTAHIETEPLGDWNEGGKIPNGTVDSFTLTLRSLTIVRDEHGQPTLDITHALKARLAVTTLEIMEVCQKGEIVGGFNRKWGLPLPQVVAIAAGSHFVIKANPDEKKLQDLQEKGIGERRAEGFGRVAINLKMPMKNAEEIEWHKVEPYIQSLIPAQGGLEKDTTAGLMTKRLLRRDLDEKILEAARKMSEKYVKGKVPNSQLSRWRVIVRDVLGKGSGNGNYGLARLQKFCENSKGKSGWQKMEKVRVQLKDSRPRLTEWIEALLNEPQDLYKVPGMEANLQRNLGSNSSTVGEMNDEYRLRLLDAVLAIMGKMNGGRNG